MLQVEKVELVKFKENPDKNKMENESDVEDEGSSTTEEEDGGGRVRRRRKRNVSYLLLLIDELERKIFQQTLAVWSFLCFKSFLRKKTCHPKSWKVWQLFIRHLLEATLFKLMCWSITSKMVFFWEISLFFTIAKNCSFHLHKSSGYLGFCVTIVASLLEGISLDDGKNKREILEQKNRGWY